MKIYLDTSVYNRPFDDQTQVRIRLESIAFRVILQLIETNKLELVSSSTLEYENSRNPFRWRQQWIQQRLRLAKYYQSITEAVKIRARELEKQGVKPVDALHVASAEVAGCKYFITSDDRLIKRYSGSLEALNPMSFVLLRTGGD